MWRVLLVLAIVLVVLAVRRRQQVLVECALFCLVFAIYFGVWWEKHV